MGNPKAAQATYTPVKSVFDGFKGSEFNLGPFGGTASFLHDGVMTTRSRLDGGLQNSFDAASQGLAANNQYLQLDPTRQFNQLDAGQNAYYNTQREQLNRNWLTDSGNSQVDMSSRGLDNSTVRGAYLGQLANDYSLRDADLRQRSLAYMNDTARQNAATNMNTLNGLYGFIAPSAGLSLNTALDAYDAIDAMAMANKQNQTQIDLANLQSRMQASQRRSGLLGSIIGGAATLGGAFLGNPAVGAAMLSDARTKRELRQLGMLGALPVYEFEYKWSKQKHVGVLAQDVAKRVPTAVKHLKNGYLAVNYDVLLEELAA